MPSMMVRNREPSSNPAEPLTSWLALLSAERAANTSTTHTSSRSEPRGHPTVYACGLAGALASPEGWVPGSLAQAPGGPRALWLCGSRALWLESQAGRLAFLCLPAFGEGISSCPGLRVRLPPRWKVPRRGPQRRAHHGNATGRGPDTGQGAAGRPSGGQERP